MCYLKLFNLFKPIMRAAYLKLSGETWKRGAIWNFWNLKCFKPIMGGLLIWNFQMRLEMRCAIWNFLTFSNPSWELLIWNFQMRLETRYAIWNFWNLKLFKHVMGGLLILNFQMRLEKEVLFEMFETWNFSNMSWGVLYLKLSDETWNEMCYLKLFYLFKPITRVAYFKLSDDLKQDMLFEMFETWNFSNMSWGLLIWNFQIRLEVRCAIWNFSNFSTHHRSWLFETFR